VLKDIKKKGKSWQDIKKGRLWEDRRDWRPSPLPV
jgi:hypothetical protein